MFLTDDQIHLSPFCVITYVLELENGKWYVGQTTNLNKRLCEHFSDKFKGSLWTSHHKPVSLHQIFIGDCENEQTIHMMQLYGSSNVRGGAWCKVDYPDDYKFPTSLEDWEESKYFKARLTKLQHTIFQSIVDEGRPVSFDDLRSKGFRKETIQRTLDACLVPPKLLDTDTQDGVEYFVPA